MSKYFMHYSPRNRLTVNPVRGFESHRLRHKSTVILIELRWTFSMPENRLKSGISAILAHKRPPLQSNSAAGFCTFYGDCGFLLCRNR